MRKSPVVSSKEEQKIKIEDGIKMREEFNPGVA
jgi:hypothetical protein